jgi:hypothetical protein
MGQNAFYADESALKTCAAIRNVESTEAPIDPGMVLRHADIPAEAERLL